MFGLFKKKPAADTSATPAVTVTEVATVPSDKPSADEAAPSWLSRLGAGLERSANKLTSGLTDLFTKRTLDDAALAELEELLITADLGPKLAASITADFGRQRFGEEVTSEEIKAFLAEAIATRLKPVMLTGGLDAVMAGQKPPFVVLMVGVNGSGKTTTLGKLAAQLKDAGHSVLLAAGDTFRAAAVEQLQAWGDRAGVPVLARGPGSNTGTDPAGLAFDAVTEAKQKRVDVVLIDTAGRLHNRDELMAELQKVVRAIKKAEPSAPHSTLLTLDATTGQNALAQVEVFKNMVALDGLVISKLDGTAKGGAVVALAAQHALPIMAIGVGEGIDDLQAFDADSFAKALLGLPPLRENTLQRCIKING